MTERKNMFKKILAVILIIIFIPVFMATVLFFSAKPTLLNPDFYKKQFNDNQIYTIAIDQGLPILVDQIGISKENSEGVDQKMVIDSIKTIITPEWLKNRVESLLDGFYDYFTGEKDTIDVKIPLSNLKQNLGQDIPDEIDLNQYFSSSKNSREKAILEKIRSVTIYHETIPIALAISSAILLLIIGLIIFKPAKRVIDWVSNAVFIPSLILLIISAVGYFAADKLSKSFFLFFNSTQSSTFNNEVFIKIIATPFFYKLLIYSSIFFLLAIAGFIVSHFLPKSESVDKPKITGH